MTSTTTSDHSSINAQSTLLWVAGVATLWLIVALARSGTTLHLGPLLVPLIPLVVARRESFAMRMTGAAAAIGLAVITVLWATGNLDGPALSPFPTALAESLAFLAVGATIGVVGIAATRRS